MLKNISTVLNETCPQRQLTTGFATLQYSDVTLGSLHVPVLLLRLGLTLAGTRRKPTTMAPFVARLYFYTALVHGELKSYPEAIRFMNIYLQLAPDAPDARQARDEIYKWELMMEKEKK